jgi:hypothetical protein
MSSSLSSLPPFPKGGVYLVGLQALRDYAISIDPNYTTTQVSDNIVKPWTENEKSSLFELIKSKHDIDPHPNISLTSSQCIGPTATVFVSHAWKYKYADLVAALEVFFEDNPEFDKTTTLFWVDIFLNDQWNAPSLPFEWWSTTFLSAIQEIGHTCLVLSPYQNPIPLTRVWCLWEIFCTSKTNSRLTVQLSQSEKDSFTRTLYDDFDQIVTDFSNINEINSDAWNPLDKQRIFSAIESSDGGFLRVNCLVTTALRNWLSETATRMLESQTDDVNHGEYAKAEVLCRKIFEATTRLCGEDHEYTCLLANNLGGLLRDQGKYEEAEIYYSKSYNGFLALFGISHKSTLVAANNLAASLQNQRKFIEAESLFRTVLNEVSSLFSFCINTILTLTIITYNNIYIYINTVLVENSSFR